MDKVNIKLKLFIGAAAFLVTAAFGTASLGTVSFGIAS